MPKYPDFPTITERRNLMEQLREAEESGNALTGNELFKNYIESLRTLNVLMDKYSQVEEEYGIPPTLDTKGKDELMQSMMETAEAGEHFLAAAMNRMSRDDPGADIDGGIRVGVPGVVSRLQDMLSKDYDMLNNYQPTKTPLSFPEIQNDARTQIVDFRGKKTGILTNKLSERIPLTVVDMQGKRHTGVFTKASYVDIKAKFDEMINKTASYYDSEKMTAALPIYKKALFNQGAFPDAASSEEVTDEMVLSHMKGKVTGLLTTYRGYLRDNGTKIYGRDPEALPDEQIIAYMYRDITNEKKVDKFLKKIGVNTDELPLDVLEALTKRLEAGCKDITNLVNADCLGLKDGDRFDQRNSAMSALAGLVGKPQLLARSTNMKFLNEDGQEIEGTFMEYANGLDLFGKNGEKEFAKICKDPFAPPCKAVSSLADLQIVDYLSGNVDRHGGNMSYIVDKETGKIVDIQAFDNDTSFGIVPLRKKGIFRQAGTESLGVITDTMAQKIMKIKPEMMKFTLRGRGLSEEEIQEACQRLETLQDAIRNGKEAKSIGDVASAGKQLCIMKKEDLEKIPINALADQKNNLFRQVRNKYRETEPKAHSKYPYDPQANRKAEKAPKFTEVSTTERIYTAGGIGESMGEMARLIKNEVTAFEVGGLSKFLRSSGKFRSMVSAVKKATKAAKRINKEIKKDDQALTRDDSKVQAQLVRANRAMEKVEKANNEYLLRKMREKNVDSPEKLLGKGKSKYEQRRIDYALKIRESVIAYKAIQKPESKEEKERKQAVVSSLDIANKRRTLGNPKPKDPVVQ